jgi:hypothetical protein
MSEIWYGLAILLAYPSGEGFLVQMLFKINSTQKIRPVKMFF